jgi:hypothetical protein
LRPVIAPRFALRYLAWFAGAVAVLLIAVAGFNRLVDPEGVFGVPTLKAISAVRPLARGDRMAKAAAAARGGYTALLAGSSRVMVGLDPEDPALAGYRTYNLGLSETNMLEQADVMAFARDHNPLELVVWGLDFLMFSDRRGYSQDYADSQFAGRGYPAVAARYLLSMDTTIGSLKTIGHNLAGDRAPAVAWVNPDGFRLTALSNVPPRKLFRDILAKGFLVGPALYLRYRYSPERVERLAREVEALADAGTQTILFVPPVHARQLEAIRVMGLWEVYETWLADLAAIGDAYADSDQVTIWNFSGYTDVTTEPVPEADSRDTVLDGYWESSHYKPALGSRLLCTVLNADCAVAPLSGSPLSGETLPAMLADIESGRVAYLADQPEEAEEVFRLCEQTAGQKHGKTCIQPPTRRVAVTDSATAMTHACFDPYAPVNADAR